MYLSEKKSGEVQSDPFSLESLIAAHEPHTFGAALDRARAIKERS